MSQSQRIRPVGSRLLLELLPSSPESEGGIFLPEESRESPLHAIVKGIGERCSLFKGAIGDVVLIERFAGNVVKGFPNLLLIHEKNILGTV